MGVILTVAVVAASFSIWLVLRNFPPIFPSPEENGSYTTEIIDRWLLKTQAKNLLNGAVLVMDHDQVLINKFYGYAEPDQKTEFTENHSFRLASLSKQFTAAAIIALKVDGQLEFDDLLSTHLPEIKWPDVTIRHLLHHTAGAPNYMWASGNFTDKNPMTITDVVKLMANKKPVHRANEKHAYSNTGYVLLAGVVERISGKTLEAYTAERLFQPLGMVHTRVWHLTSENPAFPTALKTFVRGKLKEPGAIDGLAGDGGFFSNINDLMIWDKAMRKGSGFFPDEVLKEAFTPGVLNSGEAIDYAFGWVIEENSEGHWHNGAWLGAKAYMYRNPDEGRLVIVLDNAGHEAVDYIGDDLKKHIFFEAD